MKDQSLLLVAQRAYHLAQRAMPAYASKFSKKTFTQPQLLACLILKAYLRLTYREAEAWLVATDPDNGCRGWGARRITRRCVGSSSTKSPSRCWGGCWSARCGRWRVSQPRIGFGASPSPGCGGGQHGVHSRSLFALLPLAARAARPAGLASNPIRGWPKWALAVWVRPQLICAQRAHAGPCGDFDELPPLASAARRRLPFGRLLGDAGFDSESNHWFCREWLGMECTLVSFATGSTRFLSSVRTVSCEMLSA